MTNNSININKLNNHLSLQINEHKNNIFFDGNPGAGFGHAQQCDGVKTVNDIKCDPTVSIVSDIAPFTIDFRSLLVDFRKYKYVFVLSLQFPL